MKEVKINTEELSIYIYEELISINRIPTGDDVDVLANIFFDYLLERNFIEEINPENEDK